jgi:hypothetical protein
LQKISEIADIAGKTCEYLYLSFEGLEDDHKFREDLAQSYVDVLKKFERISMLRFEVIEDSNLTNILKIMMKDTEFPWFSTVQIAKCYMVRGMKDQSLLQLFFTKLRSL